MQGQVDPDPARSHLDVPGLGSEQAAAAHRQATRRHEHDGSGEGRHEVAKPIEAEGVEARHHEGEAVADPEPLARTVPGNRSVK